MYETNTFKIAYFTVKAPYGKGEAFVMTEMMGVLKREDVDLLIIPLRPEQTIYHREAARDLAKKTVLLPMLSLSILKDFLKNWLTNPIKVTKTIIKVLYHSRPGVLFKNLAVIPKGVYIARLLRARGVNHIHAHWASTPSTCAHIASQLSGIPWSFTAHRWDIAEDNMLKEKVGSADFARAIAEDGRKEILGIVGREHKDRVLVIHLGVEVTHCPAKKVGVVPTIVCVANLVRIKGHRYLLEACRILNEKGFKIRCVLVGDGPEREAIEGRIEELGLSSQVKLQGALPHERVQEIFEKDADIVVLPSIVTDTDEKEGIPVSLMEAMSYGIPVVSTHTGGIPELLSDGAGIMVEEKNSEQLADALEELIQDKELATETGRRGYCKVDEEFNLNKNVEVLLEKTRRATTD